MVTSSDLSASTRQLLHALVLDDGRRWGEVATDWQHADADAVLDASGPRMHFQTRPRGGSKSTDLAGVAIALLLDQAPVASRSYCIAVDADQADLIVSAVRGFVTRTPGLEAALDVRARSVISRANGAQLEVLPADGASAWGLIPWLMIVDELGQWPGGRNHRQLWTAVVSSAPKSGPTGRMVCLTSAGEPSHWSYKVLAHARQSEQWRVSEVRGPLPWRSEEDLAEQRAMLTESAYARLHLNEWTEAEDRLTTVDAIDGCVRHSGIVPPAPGVQYVIALDVGLVNDATVIAVGHLATEDGSRVVVLDRMDVRQGSKGAPVDLGEVEETIAALSAVYNNARIVIDPYQAVHLAQGLRRSGHRVSEFTFSQSSTGRLGLLMYRLLRDGLFDLPDDPELLAELAGVRLRENGVGSYRLDHDAGAHDDRAVALALLAHELIEKKRSRRRSVAPKADLR